ncbi:head-tail connector protein [Clostridium saudiense]|uniref:head-tail connector protein n=1 Tax=Clostridium saudiense TaxID=1414720 RepID=UPI001A9AF1AF|nr:head-tail connector protein [Clostridium saudiense]
MTLEHIEQEWDLLDIKFITLEEIKTYLNIDLEDIYYDEMLTEYIATSLIYIIKNAGNAWMADEYCIKLAKLLQRKFILDMFENRGTEISNSTKRDIMVNTILEILASVGGE